MASFCTEVTSPAVHPKSYTYSNVSETFSDQRKSQLAEERITKRFCRMPTPPIGDIGAKSSVTVEQRWTDASLSNLQLMKHVPLLVSAGMMALDLQLETLKRKIEYGWAESAYRGQKILKKLHSMSDYIFKESFVGQQIFRVLISNDIGQHRWNEPIRYPVETLH